MIAEALNRPVPGGGLRLGDALGGCRSSGEALGRQQFDVDRRQGVDGFERGRSGVEVDAGRWPGERRTSQGDSHGASISMSTRAVARQSPSIEQEARVTGQAHRRRTALGDVDRSAPAAAVVGIDQFQRQRPVAQRVVG